MNLEYTQQLEKVLNKLSYSDDEQRLHWKYTLIDKSIIRFQVFGFINSDIYKKLARSFESLQLEYFKNAEFLVLLFDFSDFKKVTSEVRGQIIEGNIFKNERISVAIYGMNYFVSTMARVISRKQVSKRLFIVKDEAAAMLTAKQLISNYGIQKVKDLQGPNYYSQPNNTIEIGGKPYTILSRNAWSYNDPSSDYSYKIDLIDDDILISRPAGYIRYQNSVMANVLFDKVAFSEIGQNNKYYRIQDYTLVTGSENKARRDFTDYVINGIKNINLLVFYGLNRTMSTVVRLGKLVHPAFEKVQIAKTFEEALELVIAHKYKDTSKKILSEELKTPNYLSPQEEIADIRVQNTTLIKENTHYLNMLFDRISKITFGNSEDYIPVSVDEENPFYDLFSAIQLLNEDYRELKNDRNALQLKLQRIISQNAHEVKDIKIENSSKLRSKEDFIRSSGHELNLTLAAILNAIQLLKKEETVEVQKSLLEIIKMASLNLQNGIGQLNNSYSDKHANEFLSESIFNYRQNLIQLIEIARMGNHKGKIIFENKVDEHLPAFLIGDKRKFNQIVNIFLENALKFTNDGFIKFNTHVVNLSSTQTRLRLTVEDSGIGIDKFTKAHIFKDENIEEEDSINQNKGFGLLIAKNIAHVLNADIGFESDKGLGSKFWLELTFNIGYQDKLPLKQAEQSQSKTKVNLVLPFDGSNALLIMDDAIRQNLVVQILRGKGIQSRAKLNYEAFADIEGKFDFVFVCLQLIGGKEVSAFKLLKNTIDLKNDYAKPIYIGCVDTFIDPILEQYRKVGIDYFINKSFNIDELDQFFEDIK